MNSVFTAQYELNLYASLLLFLILKRLAVALVIIKTVVVYVDGLGFTQEEYWTKNMFHFFPYDFTLKHFCLG